jgi:hypothetical protein
VRRSEERSDELKIHVYEISMALSGSSVGNVAGSSPPPVSYADNTTLVMNRFALAGCVHFRHPYEVGGLTFSINYFVPLIGLVLLLFATPIYKEETELSETTVEYLQKTTMIAGSLLLFSTGLFFSLINEDFRSTWYSTETAGLMTRRTFLEGNDVSKSHTLSKNIALWSPIKDKVEEWISSNWATWEEEQPSWFTDEWKERVPVEMIPRRRKGAERAKVSEQGDKDEGAVRGKNNSRISRVMPEGKKNVDFDEFEREVKRRGSVMG